MNDVETQKHPIPSTHNAPISYVEMGALCALGMHYRDKQGHWSDEDAIVHVHLPP